MDTHDSPAGALQLARVIPAVRRQYLMIFVTIPLGLILGLAYLLTAVPRYTASADLLISGQGDKLELSRSISDVTLDTSAIDSQVEVLKSKKIALAVVDALNLTRDVDFMHPSGGLASRTIDYVKSLLRRSGLYHGETVAAARDMNQLKLDAASRLEDNLDIRRVGHTYVLTAAYTDPSRDRAAAVANAFAEAYLAEGLDSKFEATRHAAEWLQSRLSDLRKKSIDSDLAVQRFKADHGLVETGGDRPGLIADQQLTEVNTEIAVSRADTAKAEARYTQIEDLLKSGRVGASVPDSLSDPIISDLRQKILTATKTETDLEATVGPNHLQVTAIKQTIGQYETQIIDELRRIADSYRSDMEVARAKEKSLTETMSRLVEATGETNQTMVQLRELQRESETYRGLYQTFLQRYQEAVQQQSSPVSEARVITPASPPENPSAPRGGPILLLSGLVGLMAGVGLGAFREHRDRVFRSGSEVREELGLEFLGSLPLLRLRRAQIRQMRRDFSRAPSELEAENPLLRYSIDHPISSFSETLRAAKVAIDSSTPEGRSRIVGVTSMFPEEGKSTVSKNLASLLAQLGEKTILVDADLRNPGLTRNLAPRADSGLVEAIQGERPLEDVVLSEKETGLRFIPSVLKERVPYSSAALSSVGMRNVLKQIAELYDYVIVDLPPLGPVVDVRAAASMFDVFLFVIEWGKTPKRVVLNSLRVEGALGDKCVGVISNKTDMMKLHLYEDEGSKELYFRQYSKYYLGGNASRYENSL